MMRRILRRAVVVFFLMVAILACVLLVTGRMVSTPESRRQYLQEQISRQNENRAKGPPPAHDGLEWLFGEKDYGP